MVDTRDEYARLAGVYLPVAIAVFTIVVAVMTWSVVRYRAGRRPGRTASCRADAPRLESAYVLVLLVVAAGLVAATFTVESRTDALAARPALRVDVTAAQWNWRFAYPGTGVVTGPSPSGLSTVVVPTGRTVRFRGRSLDVIHDFWIPDLRFQRQLFPEHEARFDLVFRRPGTYQGVCALFCGLYHENMHFDVRAVTPSQFSDWLARRRTDGQR